MTTAATRNDEIRACEAISDVARMVMVGAKEGSGDKLQRRVLPSPELDQIVSHSASYYA